jgi:hypothetical protein
MRKCEMKGKSGIVSCESERDFRIHFAFRISFGSIRMIRVIRGSAPLDSALLWVNIPERKGEQR